MIVEIVRLITDGGGAVEPRTLAGACDPPQWQDGLVMRAADPKVCRPQRK
jgi:hypothetical protein